jgi:hypothetical protein
MPTEVDVTLLMDKYDTLFLHFGFREGVYRSPTHAVYTAVVCLV